MTKKILSIISVILCIVLICPIYVSANDESVYTSHKTDSGKICFNGFATTNNVSKTISLHLTEMLLAKENYKQADSFKYFNVGTRYEDNETIFQYTCYVYFENSDVCNIYNSVEILENAKLGMGQDYLYYSVLTPHDPSCYAYNNYAVVTIQVKYRTTHQQDEEIESLAKITATNLKITDSSKSDYEKLKIMYDYFTSDPFKFCEGHSQHAPTSSKAKCYSPYNVFKNHVGVCQAYAHAFQLVCKYAGIKCWYLSGFTSDALGHGWDMVKLNGKAYYIDVTNYLPNISNKSYDFLKGYSKGSITYTDQDTGQKYTLKKVFDNHYEKVSKVLVVNNSGDIKEIVDKIPLIKFKTQQGETAYEPYLSSTTGSYGDFSASTTPLSVAVSFVSATSCKLSWKLGNNNTSYIEVQYKVEGGNYVSYGTYANTKTSLNITVTSGKNYTFKVISYNKVNGVKKIIKEEIVEYKPITAKTCTNTKATNISTTSFTLSWDKIDGTNIYYEVYRYDNEAAANSNNVNQRRSIGRYNKTSISVTQLKSKTTYYYRVVPYYWYYNTNGDVIRIYGKFSPVVKVTTK